MASSFLPLVCDHENSSPSPNFFLFSLSLLCFLLPLPSFLPPIVLFPRGNFWIPWICHHDSSSLQQHRLFLFFLSQENWGESASLLTRGRSEGEKWRYPFPKRPLLLLQGTTHSAQSEGGEKDGRASLGCFPVQGKRTRKGEAADRAAVRTYSLPPKAH